MSFVDMLRMAQILILVFGFIVVFFAFRGYARRKSSALLLLGTGFGIVSIGAVVAGALFEVMNVDLLTATTIQAYFQVIGFFIIVYSLRTKT